jgi:hypothetical protein
MLMSMRSTLKDRQWFIGLSEKTTRLYGKGMKQCGGY